MVPLGICNNCNFRIAEIFEGKKHPWITRHLALQVPSFVSFDRLRTSNLGGGKYILRENQDLRDFPLSALRPLDLLSATGLILVWVDRLIRIIYICQALHSMLGA